MIRNRFNYTQKSFKDVDYVDEKDLEAKEMFLGKLNKLFRLFNFITRNLSLDRNFSSSIVEVSFAAGETKTISHFLGVKPKYRIILRQEGNGVLSDIPYLWSNVSATIINNGSVAVRATIMFLKE
jgi:hypothetical protein